MFYDKMNLLNRPRVRSWLALVGGVIIHIVLGSIHTIGNLNPYVTSYIRARSSPSSLRHVDTTWLLGIGDFCFGMVMFLSGTLMRVLGPGLAVFLVSLLISGSVAVSYFTIKMSFWALVLTYGVLYGCGIGLSYAIPLACVIKWMPEKKGMVSGIVLAGFGAGTFIFIQIQTLFINPWNLVPDDPSNTTVPIYFCQDELLDRVPYVFLILGGIFFLLQIIVAPMLSVPDEENGEGKSLIDRTEIPLQPKDQTDTYSLTQTGEEGKEDSEMNSENREFSTREMMGTRLFYLLWLIFFLNGQSVFVAVSLYKVYAESYIQDDIFLGIIGSVACAFNTAGRIIWGIVADRFSFRAVKLGFCVSTIILFMTFLTCPLSQEGQKPMTFIWVCLIYLIYPGIIPLMSTVISDAFGNKDLATKIGLIYTSQAGANVFGAMLTVTIFPVTGWVGLYSVVSGCSLIAGALVFSCDINHEIGTRRNKDYSMDH